MSNEMVLTFVSLIGAAILAGVTAASVYFKTQRNGIRLDIEAGDKSIHKELTVIKNEIRERMRDQHEADIKIVALQEKSVNNVRRLDEIFKATQTTNAKIDSLAETMGRAVIAFRSGGKHDP